MNYIFIGNGIISLSTALNLKSKLSNSCKLTIIGESKRPGSATLAAAAMLNSFCEIEEDTFKNDINSFKFELSRNATIKWPEFIKEYSNLDASKSNKDKCFNTYGDLGTYLINNTSADNLDDLNYEAIINGLKKFNEPYNEIIPRDIPGYRPNQTDRSNRAIFIKNEGWVNPNITIKFIQETLEKDDRILFLNDRVTNIKQKNGKIDHVVLSSGVKLSGDKYLLASGANVSDLLFQSKIDINIPRIFYGVGVSLLLSNQNNEIKKCIRTPNRGLACGVYAVPYNSYLKNDKIVLGATNLISHKPINRSRVISVYSLLENIVNQINNNFYKSEIDRINIGWRPTSADTFPLIGGTSLNNLIIATGTKRDGFHLSPVISEALVSILLNKKVDKRFEFFKPERKLIHLLSREQAIKKSVSHLMSASYQHGFNPGYISINNNLKSQFKDDLERLHDKVGAFDWGIPTEMIDMYRHDHINYK